jgi:hypothetical protein
MAAQTLAEVDREVFGECLAIAQQNAPGRGVAWRWCLALGYFRESKGRPPQFDVGRAWRQGPGAQEVA